MNQNGRPLSRRERLVSAIAIFWLAAAAAGGVLLAANHPGPHRHHHSVGFIALVAIALALLVGAAAWLGLRRGIRRPTVQRLRAFPFADRRATAKAVQRGRPLTNEQRTIAEAVVEHFSGRSQRRAGWIMPLAAVLFGINAVIDSGGLRWIWVGLMVLEAACAATWIWYFRRLIDRYRRALIASEPS